jgi:hypothetical protein
MNGKIRNDGHQPLREGWQPVAKIAMPKGAIKGLQPMVTNTPPPPPPPTAGNTPVSRPKK